MCFGVWGYFLPKLEMVRWTEPKGFRGGVEAE